MKISQLIEQLEWLKEKRGDNEISLNIKDHYTRYGHPAKFAYNPERDEIWGGTFTNGNQTTIDIHLYCQDEKHPKITFRKQ